MSPPPRPAPGASAVSAGGEAALACGEVSLRLGGVVVLDGVGFAVEPGEIVALVGPSGAGKSTLFRVLAGELRADSGWVRLAGRDVTTSPLWTRARLGLGWIPQSPSVLLDLDVAANLRAFERAARVQPKAPADRASELALGDVLGTPARALSGGERRRLEVLRALVAEPRALLCDEPLAGLDAPLAAAVLERLRAASRGGAAVLIADHRLAELLPVCDRVLRLAGGRLERAVPVATLARDPDARGRLEP